LSSLYDHPPKTMLTHKSTPQVLKECHVLLTGCTLLSKFPTPHFTWVKEAGNFVLNHVKCILSFSNMI